MRDIFYVKKRKQKAQQQRKRDRNNKRGRNKRNKLTPFCKCWHKIVKERNGSSKIDSNLIDIAYAILFFMNIII